DQTILVDATRSLAGVSPPDGPAYQRIVVTGAFGASPTLAVGGVAAKIVATSARSIEAVVPAGAAAGASFVQVAEPGVVYPPLPFTVTALSGGPAPTAWPMAQANRDRTGEIPVPASVEARVKWSAPFTPSPAPLGGMAVRGDGALVVTGGGGYVAPFLGTKLRETGEALGQVPLPFSSPFPNFFAPTPSAPAVDREGNTYVVVDGVLMAFGPALNLLWSSPGAGYAANPVLGADGTIMTTGVTFSGGPGAQAVVSATRPDGVARWLTTVFLPGSQMAPPLVQDDGSVFLAGAFGGDPYRVRGGSVGLGPDGTLAFTGPEVQGIEHATTLVHDPVRELAFVGGASSDFFPPVKHLFALRTTDGSMAWSANLQDGGSCCLGLAGALDRTHDVLYATSRGSSLNGLLALDPGTGDIRWRSLGEENQNLSPGQLVDAAGNVYSGDGTALIAVAPDGTRRWTLPVSGSGAEWPIA
ncbi:MAG: hypothetical protein AAB368_07140, partial [bacterium]